MTSIIFPDNTVEIIDSIRGAIGRNVTFTVLDTTTECPICDLDPITNTSVDSFCPTCSGLHYINTYEDVLVSGHITWKSADELNWYSAGTVMDGDCRVQIKNSDENLALISGVLNMTVDDRVMEISKVIPLGAPQLNRIALILKEVEESE